MSNIYVRSTDGNNSDNGSTWALAKATLAGADAIDAAGDSIYLSQAHTESSASTITYALAGTLTNPTKLICANDAAEPPTATATSAVLGTTGASNLRVSGSAYVHGITFNCGNAAVNFASLMLNYTGSQTQTYRDCALNLIDQHPTSRIQFGSNSTGDSGRTYIKNCTLKLSSTGQAVEVFGDVRINGGSMLSGTSSPTSGLFTAGGVGTHMNLLVENFDFSNLGSTFAFFTSTTQKSGRALIRNCKMPASWTGNMTSAAIALPNLRVELVNCDSADTNYRVRAEDYWGKMRDETTIVKTSGASDGTTPISWKVDANSNTNDTGVFRTSEMYIWNDTTGVSKTITVDILRDSVTNLTDEDIWLEVEYMGTSGNPIGTEATSQKATVLTTPTAHASSSATWTTTGLTNPNKQKLTVTFTPVKKGAFAARVAVARTMTVYVDPLLQVT